MKSTSLFTIILILFFCSCNTNNSNSESESKEVSTEKKEETKSDETLVSIKIGNQNWANKNLNITHFRNGDIIPESNSLEEWRQNCKNKKPTWCYYNFTALNTTGFGIYYNIYAVIDPRELAPNGWHISTADEWETLLWHLGGTGSDVSDKLMSSSDEWGLGKFKNKIRKGNNISGFNAVPEGHIGYSGNENEFTNAEFWTTNKQYEDGSYITYRGFNLGIDVNNHEDIFKPLVYRDYEGVSVRCLKGNAVKPSYKIPQMEYITSAVNALINMKGGKYLSTGFNSYHTMTLNFYPKMGGSNEGVIVIKNENGCESVFNYNTYRCLINVTPKESTCNVSPRVNNVSFQIGSNLLFLEIDGKKYTFENEGTVYEGEGD